MSTSDVVHKPQLQVGEWFIDVQSNTLRNEHQEITLEPKVMSLLAFLCEHHGQTLSKDTILKNVWGSTHFADSVVARAVSLLRQSLGDKPGEPRYIQTIARRGYRWIAPVEQPPETLQQPPETDHASDLPQRDPVNKPGAWETLRIPIVVALVVTALSASVFMIMDRMDHETSQENDPVASTEQIRTIAMVPLQVAADPESLRYVGEGLQEDIVMQLSRHRAMRLAELPSNVADGLDAARALQAKALLSGAVELSDEMITVRLALQNPENAALYWSETFSEPIEDTQRLRNRIVNALLDVGRPSESRDDRKVQLARVVEADAYQAYLEARWHSHQRSYASMERGEALFKQLTISHPEYAAGHAGLALSYIVRVSYFNDDPDAGYARADAAASQALKLDPHNAQALTAKAQVLFHRDWDFSTAAAYLQQAIEASPGNVDARQYLAELYTATGQHALALTVIDDALERQPYSLLLMGVRGILLCASGNYEATIEQFEELERYGPSFTWQYRYWGYAYERLGKPIEAALAKSIRHRSKMTETEREAFVDLMQQSNGKAYWQWVGSRTPDESRQHTGISFFARAELLAVDGQFDEAMVWLKKAIERRGQVFLLYRISPALDPIRERQDYQRLLARLGVPIHQPHQQHGRLSPEQPR